MSSGPPPVPPTAEKALEKLKKKLPTIWLEVDVIESKESQTKSDQFRLKSLKTIAFDAEDIIADCDYELLRSRIELQAPGKRKRRDGEEEEEEVWSYSSSGSFDWEEAEWKMGKILTGYDSEESLSKSLGLKKGDGKVKTWRGGSSSGAWQQTGSLPSERRILGREKDMRRIIRLITRDSKKVVVFPLIGPPGTGKTTLIQHVCCDSEVASYFKLMGWVFMSESFDGLKLMKAIFESLARRPCDSNDLDAVQEELGQVLCGKKFLLVLDDVWTKDSRLWESFWTPLASAVDGGVVMILTRDYGVCRAMPSKITQALPAVLEPLNDKDCSSLFNLHMSGDENVEVPSELARIGQKIVEKCKGLPLAVKAAASVLARHYDAKRRSVQEFSQGDILDVVVRQGGALPDLKSSYRRLSAPLKRCIAYCSLFPEHYKFDKEELIRLWIAEGFIHPEDGKKKLEDIGSEYFDELFCQSFFQYSRKDLFVIPILVDDPFEHLRIKGEYSIRALSEVRHSSYVVHDYNSKVICEPLVDAKALRTFLVISNEDISRIDLSPLPKMRYLRTLDLCCMDIKELPESLGDLKHLRFLGLRSTGVRILPKSMCRLYNLQSLDLSYSELEEVPEYIGDLKQLRFLGLNGTAIGILPDSICMLYHLQALELMYCGKLEELPSDMRNMISLRHLRVDKDYKFCMPARIEELIGLQTLQRFNVGGADGYAGIRELRGLENIRRELYISGLCNVSSIDDCKVANLESKQFIEKLTLAWPSHVVTQQEEETDDDDYDQNFSDEDAEEINLEDGELPYNDHNAPHINAKGEITSNERHLTADNQSSTVYCRLMFMESTREEVHVLNSSLCDVSEQGTAKHIEQVLDSLKPHNNLGILIVQSYHGIVFPEWMVHKSFTKLMSVTLEDCKNCDRLPSFGLLPSLKYLTIDHMHVGRVGSEFCRGVEELQNKCFPELYELRFKELYELEEWTGVRDGDFPKLESVTIFNCPKLRGIPYFDSLKTLEIENCGVLKTLLELPFLETLRLVACDVLVNLPNLECLHNLTVMYCSGLVSVPELPSLKNLWIEDCERLKSLDFLTNCSSTAQLLEKLSLLVINCPALEFSSDKKLPTTFDRMMLMTWFQNHEQAASC